VLRTVHLNSGGAKGADLSGFRGVCEAASVQTGHSKHASSSSAPHGRCQTRDPPEPFHSPEISPQAFQSRKFRRAPCSAREACAQAPYCKRLHLDDQCRIASLHGVPVPLPARCLCEGSPDHCRWRHVPKYQRHRRLATERPRATVGDGAAPGEPG